MFPVVAYYRPEPSDDLSVQSFVIISDEENHDASAVYAFLQKLLPDVKEPIPEIGQAFYGTDSPTSQFTSKSVFQIISIPTKTNSDTRPTGISLKRAMARVHTMVSKLL